MNNVTFKGNPITLNGTFPQTGQSAPEFTLTTTELSDKSLSDYSTQRKILNIFPSIDTGVCAKSVREFNEKAAKLENAVVLCISADLPFAQSRFCGAEGIDNVEMLSCFKTPEFKTQYGVAISDGPIAGLCARAVLVLDSDNRILHSELVSEIGQEPNYQAALDALN